MTRNQQYDLDIIYNIKTEIWSRWVIVCPKCFAWEWLEKYTTPIQLAKPEICFCLYPEVILLLFFVEPWFFFFLSDISMCWTNSRVAGDSRYLKTHVTIFWWWIPLMVSVVLWTQTLPFHISCSLVQVVVLWNFHTRIKMPFGSEWYIP